MAALLQLDSISKSFGATAALKNISLQINPGEVCALIGENGAGKSTLIKILSGIHQPDAGCMRWQGTPTAFPSPRAALASGIATIHQELACFERLTVSENILMDEAWPKRLGMVRWDRLHDAARKRLAVFDVNLDPSSPMGLLSSAQRQEVAIARSLSKNAKLLILDEPTASLTEPEVRRLLAKILQLRQTGVAILYVSHRLDEILQIAQHIVVLRDGLLVANYPARDASVPGMVRDMVGRRIEEQYSRKKKHEMGAAVLELDSLSRQSEFNNISLRVRSGEILGLAGLIGAGRSELARAIFGLSPIKSGSIKVNGKPFTPRSPADALDAGIVYVPEERKRQGFALDQSVRDSLTIAMLKVFSVLGWIKRLDENRSATQIIGKYSVRAGSLDHPVGSLSGGNQQKVLLARWLEKDPAIIILDEPTRGVDVGAKAEIHRLIDELAARGKTILLISSDLPEIIALSDRVLVLCHGSIAAELNGGQITQENILLAASGLHFSSQAYHQA